MGHALVRRSPLQGDPDRFDTDMLHGGRQVLIAARIYRGEGQVQFLGRPPHAEVGHAGEPLDLGSGAGGFDSRPRYFTSGPP